MKAYYRIENSVLTNYQDSIVICEAQDWEDNISIGTGKRSILLYEELEEFDIFDEIYTQRGVYKISEHPSVNVEEFLEKVSEASDIEFIQNPDFIGYCKDSSNKDFNTYYYCKTKDKNEYAICPKIYWDENGYISDLSEIGIDEILEKCGAKQAEESIWYFEGNFEDIVKRCQENGVYLVKNDDFSKFILK